MPWGLIVPVDVVEVEPPEVAWLEFFAMVLAVGLGWVLELAVEVGLTGWSSPQPAAVRDRAVKLMKNEELETIWTIRCWGDTFAV